MEALSRWLEKKDIAAEEMALDYLNKKGFFGKSKKLSAIDQIREIEKENARDLYFKDCERKLKNNIRQNISKNKNPDFKPCTFKLSSKSRHLLEKIKNHYGITAGQVLEMLIHNEDAKLLRVTNHHLPQVNNLQNNGMSMHYNPSHVMGQVSDTTLQYDARYTEQILQTLSNLDKITENNNKMFLNNEVNDYENCGLI